MDDPVKKPRKNSYSKEEIDLLQETYSCNTKDKIISLFEKYGFSRSWQSIRVTALKLGLSRDPDIIKDEMIKGGSNALCPSNKNPWTSVERDLLHKIYPNSLRDEILPHFPGRTWKAIREYCTRLGLARSKEMIDQDNKNTLMKNYGVKSTWQLSHVQESSRKTNQLKRGVDYAIQSKDVRKKVKETVREKYGVDNVFQSEEIKEKIKKTNIEKYGTENPHQNDAVQNKAQDTCLERYGVRNPFEMVDRVKAGMLEKYGVESPLQHPDILKKTQKTNILRYGFPTAAQNKDVRNKIEETTLNRFGVKTPFQNDAIKRQIKRKNLLVYKVENPAQNEVVKAKIYKTCIEKYGVKSFLCLEEVRRKGRELAILNNSIGKSKGEDNFNKYLKILDPKVIQHKEHPVLKHVIDYYLPQYDLWVQYDGDYWHGKIKRDNINTKQYLKILKTVERDQIQSDQIPNLIRFWSSEVDRALKSNTVFKLITDKIDEKCKFNSICHQFQKKLDWYQSDLIDLSFDPTKLKASSFDLFVEFLTPEIKQFIEKYEWLGTIGFNVKWCFTARFAGTLSGVLLLSEPASYSTLLGHDTPLYEAIIQRGATVSWAPKNLGSRLIMFACHWMTQNTSKRLFIGYADPEAHERGIIYRACNFDYVGDKFGDTFLYKHPDIPNEFSSRYLRRTSTFKSWCRNRGIELQSCWFKENQFKDLKNIPPDIKSKWYSWGRQILQESIKIKLKRKMKYALIRGKDKRDTFKLRSMRTYTPLDYPKEPAPPDDTKFLRD